MKRRMIVIAALLIVQAALSGCSGKPAGSSTDATAPVITEAATAANTDESTAPDFSNMVLIKINIEGYGGTIAFSDDGSDPVFDDEFPAQSAFTHVTPGGKVTLAAKGIDQDFIKWKKDGQDYSTDVQITVTADADAEYVAVFGDDTISGEPVDLDSAKTLGDVLSIPSNASSCDEEHFVRVFNQDGTYYRVIADFTPDLFEQYNAVDWEDEAYEEKTNAILAPLPIVKIENLSAAIPPQEELDKLIGKSGEELLGDDWYSNGWNLEDMEFYMTHGLFQYIVGMQGDVSDPENFSDDDLKSLTVTSVTFNDLGDATNLEYSVD